MVPELVWRDPEDWGVRVHGLPWRIENDRAWSRAPLRRADVALPGFLPALAGCPSGARLRFRTDARSIGIRIAYHVDGPAPRNIPFTGAAGVDLWLDGRFWTIAAPASLEEGLDKLLFAGERAWRDVTLYLPYYAAVERVALGLGDGAAVAPPAPFACAELLAFYGSSIMHGACATRPSLTLPARVARALALDFVNLGMTSSAPVELAALLGELPAAAYILELGTNFYGAPDRFPAACAAFLDRLRAAHPTTPIVAFGPIASSAAVGFVKRGLNQTAGLNAIRPMVEREVARRRTAGDSQITFVSGLDLLGADELDGLTDDLHPNDQGFRSIAERLLPKVQAAIDPRIGSHTAPPR